MKPEEANYVVRYYSRLMTREEKAAYKHLAAALKATMGRSDAAQEEARTDKIFGRWLTDDPRIMPVIKDGYEPFVARTAARILSEHKDDVFLNYCPRCHELARTPKARQCGCCGFDWHAEKHA